MNYDTENHTAPAAQADDTELLATNVVKTPDLAWSAADDTPTIAAYQPGHHTRWITSIAAVLISTTAVVGALYYLQQPRNPTTHPTPTVPPPKTAPAPSPAQQPAPIDPDHRFMALLKAQGTIDVGSHAQQFAEGGIDPGLVQSAHDACTLMDRGYTIPELVDQAMHGWNTSQPQAANFVDSALAVYCPQHLAS